MKLYFSPGACSLSPHIVAREAGVELTLVKTNTKTKKLDDGSDFYDVNPKGYVPALVLDDGELLTEGPAIVQYLGDQKPDSGVMPAAGTMQRYRVQEMLGYIGTEIHKSYSPLFATTTPEETRTERKEYLQKRYALLDEKLGKSPYLCGEQFTAADAYLFTVTRWAPFVKVDLSAFANLAAFQERVAARPAVQSALAAEGVKG